MVWAKPASGEFSFCCNPSLEPKCLYSTYVTLRKGLETTPSSGLNL